MRSHNEPLQPSGPSPDLAKQPVRSFDYCTMLLTVPGEIFISDVITEQEPTANLAVNQSSDIEDQLLVKDDGIFSTQIAQEVHDIMDIYGLPNPQTGNEQPSESIHHDAENTRQIPVPPPKISVPRDVAGNCDAPPRAA